MAFSSKFESERYKSKKFPSSSFYKSVENSDTLSSYLTPFLSKYLFIKIKTLLLVYDCLNHLQGSFLLFFNCIIIIIIIINFSHFVKLLYLRHLILFKYVKEFMFYQVLPYVKYFTPNSALSNFNDSISYCKCFILLISKFSGLFNKSIYSHEGV